MADRFLEVEHNPELASLTPAQIRAARGLKQVPGYCMALSPRAIETLRRNGVIIPDEERTPKAQASDAPEEKSGGLWVIPRNDTPQQFRSSSV